jgi:hypothetical protein
LRPRPIAGRKFSITKAAFLFDDVPSDVSDVDDVKKMIKARSNVHGGRYWDRTSGLFRVKEALFH